MDKATAAAVEPDDFVIPDPIPESRKRLGRMVFAAGTLMLVAIALMRALQELGIVDLGFATWRPVLYAYIFWGVMLGWSQVLRRGEDGKRALFVLPAALFVVAMVVFPLLFALYVSFTDWNLSSLDGPEFNGLDNLRRMADDPFYWNAMLNMVWYTLAIVAEYAIAFGLALVLHSQIRARKFFRVVFLLPLMLSPVALSWMVGKSMMENRFGPLANFARWLGWENPAFFADPWLARLSIMVMDAWTFIPLMMIILLAGLQSLPREVMEAARVDGATPWQTFWKITFPLMLPVSITAVIIRVIFKLKLADIIINVTSGGPGGATDSVTSFIFREYRDRSNVGYGTLLAVVYLVIIVAFLVTLLNLLGRWMRGYDQEVN
ncbi:carbohydrate ABC transporter permease [Chelativorans intermedius]|uniref:Carbohydrate ABC transporter permease n=1 Tax=Chelativorans intermedius TaxID=515947 RepID=A0ABV6DB04_9HYPH|nr:sugar ABC transporter permease [Chelativorans intermedius]MCT9000222.1 sugar ABC transporter permease [Chelativorans intermedius]